MGFVGAGAEEKGPYDEEAKGNGGGEDEQPAD